MLPQQLQSSTMHLRTFWTATMSCPSPWSVTTWILGVMQLPFIIGTLVACSDDLNTEVMALMYLAAKQPSSYTIGTHWRCEGHEEVTPSLDGSDKYWHQRSLQEMPVVPYNHTMYGSIIIWLQGAPGWMCLRLWEHLQQLLKCDHDAVITHLTDWVCMQQPHSHRSLAPKADSNSTHIANKRCLCMCHTAL